LAFNIQEISDFACFYGFHYDSLDPVPHIPPEKTMLTLDAGDAGLVRFDEKGKACSGPVSCGSPGGAGRTLRRGGGPFALAFRPKQAGKCISSVILWNVKITEAVNWDLLRIGRNISHAAL
jgi:hypothetical protein